MTRVALEWLAHCCYIGLGIALVDVSSPLPLDGLVLLMITRYSLHYGSHSFTRLTWISLPEYMSSPLADWTRACLPNAFVHML